MEMIRKKEDVVLYVTVFLLFFVFSLFCMYFFVFLLQRIYYWSKSHS